ncbi:MAG: transposase [Haloplasmataceae bacterium]|jgi:transposase|nr:transposase [Haloplasmataceae bacterium]
MLTKRLEVQDELILSTLDELVPEDHLVRKLDELDFTFIYDLVTPYYSLDGRPSVDPIVIIKIMLIKQLFNMNSIKKTMKEIEVNVAYRWFLKIPMSLKIPHYTVIYDNFKNRFNKDLIFERIFKQILQEALDKKIISEKECNIKNLNLIITKNKTSNKVKVIINDLSLYNETLV